MPKKPTPWSASTATYTVLGSPRAANLPQNGAVATVTSDEMPRIQPVQRSVDTGSVVLRRWMWKGRLTNTNDHAKDPRNIASGRT